MRKLGGDVIAALAEERVCWFHLLELPGERYHTDCDVPVFARGHLYRPWGFSAGTPEFSADTIVDSVKIKAANVDQALLPAFLGGDMQGQPARLLCACMDTAGRLIGEPFSLITGTIDAWDLDEQTLSFSITNQLYHWQRCTLRSCSGHCRWRSFGDADCGCAEGACDRSYSRCVTLGNEARFGGFRHLPDLKGRAVAWGGQSRELTTDPPEHLPVVYGERWLEGADVFLAAKGDDLWIVSILAEGPCAGITELTLEDKPAADFGDHVAWWFHDGSTGQEVNAELHAACPEWTDRLSGTACVVWRLRWSGDKFSGIPRRRVKLRGRTLLDPRTGQTGYSTNPALAVRDYLAHHRYGLALEGHLDEQSVITAADRCDADGWSLNLVIDGDPKADDLLQDLLRHGRLQLGWWDDIFRLRAIVHENPCLAVGDEHIVRDTKGKAQLKVTAPGRFKRCEGLTVKYVSRDGNDAELPLGQGGDTSLDLPGCDNRRQASRLGLYDLERRRLDRILKGTFRPDLFRLEPGDVVAFSSSALGLDAQPLRVTVVGLRDDGLLDIKFIWEAESLYDDDYDVEPDEAYHCDLPDPATAPPAVSNVSLSEETYHYRGRSFTRLKIDFGPPSDFPWWSHAEIYLSLDGNEWKHLHNAVSGTQLDPVEEGRTYHVRIKSVSITGAKQPDEEDYRASRRIQGRTAPPGSLTRLDGIVNASTVNLYASRLEDPDIALYEFRLGSSWSGGLFLAQEAAPNLSILGVKPGVHTFWSAPLSNNGRYGQTPRSTSVCLDDPPPGWSIHSERAGDYNDAGESHQGTERILYGGEPYLRATHAGGDLSGTYLSPVFDLGSEQRLLFYALAEVTLTGAGTRWADVIPGDTTWEAAGITRPWSSIFSLPDGPSVRMSLLYGASVPPERRAEKQEILSALVTSRYCRLEIRITDPADAVHALVSGYKLCFCRR